MEKLKHMKECLIACTMNQISGHLDQVDTKELGEAIDMIKDLEEAIYYATITEAMEEKSEQKEYKGSPRQPQQYYTPMYQQSDPSMERRYYQDNMYQTGSGNGGQSRRYAGSQGGSGNSGGNSSRYYDWNYDDMYMSDRDVREGSSPMYRKMYMESKESHHDKAKQMKELESYVHELSNDVLEMIKDASPEEKQLLQQKISVLATKIK